MTEGGSTVFGAIGEAFSEWIAWVGEFLTALTSADGALGGLLLPLAIGIAASVVLFCVKVVRKVTWGS